MTTDLFPASSDSLSLTPNLEEVLAEARRNSLTRDNPLLADLPGWFVDLRDHQRVAVREILTAYEEGAECVVLDAPTGSGKTLIGETVRRLLAASSASHVSLCGGGMARQTTYICSSKALQDQFLRDYPYAKVLKGRSNYATELYPERFTGRDPLSAADCTKSPGDSESCLWCSSTARCPYEQAKSTALRSELAVLNTSYFLSECNGPGRFSRGGLVIADEADTLEGELMGHVEVRISERRLRQYGLSTPRFVTKEESWREWAEEAVNKVRNSPPRQSTGNDLLDIRARKRHDILLGRLRDLRKGLEDGNWVYTGDKVSVAFKPVTVAALGQTKFWQHGDKFLLMSATVISADELLESLGWDEEREWRLVKVPSTFKPENRRVVVWPVASMTWKTKEESAPKVCEAVREIIQRHPGERVLIHSTSYDLTRQLDEYLRPVLSSLPGRSPLSLFSYASSSDKDLTIAQFRQSTNSILIGPSVDRGIDLPDDECRVVIIAKVPFPYLRDKQVSARLYGTGRAGQVWYAVSTIRKIVQMTGRAVRSETDWCVSYILDRQFVDNVWYRYKRLVPSWWAEALEWKMKGL